MANYSGICKWIFEKQISREVETCGIRRKNPHPNVRAYYDYIETHGQVNMLCFKRYASILLQATKPQHLGKVASLPRARELVKEYMKTGLERILSATQHPHSIGIVLRDISPANIILGEDSILILLDFDSCWFIAQYCAVLDRKEPTTGTTLLWRLRLRKTTSTRFKMYNSS
jgi:serine/threonine protein kinase